MSYWTEVTHTDNRQLRDSDGKAELILADPDPVSLIGNSKSFSFAISEVEIFSQELQELPCSLNCGHRFNPKND